MPRTHRNGTRRGVRTGAVVATVVGLALSTGLVWQASYSAYSATTNNPGDSWTTGTVALSDDDSGAAMWNVSNLKPGATDTHCIAVTSSGSLPSVVKFYGTALTTTKSLSSYITLTVTQGTGGSFGSCTGYTQLGSGASVYSGTLAGLSANNSYATGIPLSWAPTGTGSETRTFQFTYTLASTPTLPDTTQGGNATVTFTWEAQNT